MDPQLSAGIIIAIVVAVVVIALVVWFLVARSRLRAHDLRADEAWHEIEMQLKRRADLVPSVVEAVRGGSSPDPQVLAEIDQARAATLDAADPAASSAAENRFQGALRALFGAAEASRELAASPEFLQLKADLVQTEDRIQSARRHYNGEVRGLNAAVGAFPNRLVAGAAGVARREFFEVADRAAISEPPRVQF